MGALGAGSRGGLAPSARATATATAIAMTDFTASNATAIRRSLAARAQGKTTGTTAFPRIVSQAGGNIWNKKYGPSMDRVEGATGRRVSIACALPGCLPAREDRFPERQLRLEGVRVTPEVKVAFCYRY